MTPSAHVMHDLACVLIVDDDPILREFAVVNLSTETVEIETAADGLQALDLLERRVFDLVLLDLEMPRMDGFEFLERIRQDSRWAQLPVIVATGREDIVAIDRAYEAGATAFTVKPLNWRLLSYQMRFVLRAQRAERMAATDRAELRASLNNQSDLVDDLIGLCGDGRELEGLDAQRKLLSALSVNLADLQFRLKSAG